MRYIGNSKAIVNLQEEEDIQLEITNKATATSEITSQEVELSTGNNSDLQCMLCELKGHKVTNCRKLTRAKELLRKDKQRY